MLIPKQFVLGTTKSILLTFGHAWFLLMTETIFNILVLFDMYNKILQQEMLDLENIHNNYSGADTDTIYEALDMVYCVLFNTTSEK